MSELRLNIIRCWYTRDILESTRNASIQSESEEGDVIIKTHTLKSGRGARIHTAHTQPYRQPMFTFYILIVHMFHCLFYNMYANIYIYISEIKRGEKKYTHGKISNWRPNAHSNKVGKFVVIYHSVPFGRCTKSNSFIILYVFFASYFSVRRVTTLRFCFITLLRLSTVLVWKEISENRWTAQETREPQSILSLVRRTNARSVCVCVCVCVLF